MKSQPPDYRLKPEWALQGWENVSHTLVNTETGQVAALDKALQEKTADAAEKLKILRETIEGLPVLGFSYDDKAPRVSRIWRPPLVEQSMIVRLKGLPACLGAARARERPMHGWKKVPL